VNHGLAWCLAMMDIGFSDREIELIKIWADTTLHGGRYGDGDALFPDEAIVLAKLDKTRRTPWTARDFEIILLWAERAVRGGKSGKVAVNIEEQKLLEKIRRAIGEIS